MYIYLATPTSFSEGMINNDNAGEAATAEARALACTSID